MMRIPELSPEANNPLISKAITNILSGCPVSSFAKELSVEMTGTLRSQILIVLSPAPLASSPGLDGSKAKERTGFVWPARVVTNAYVTVFQILMR